MGDIDILKSVDHYTEPGRRVDRGGSGLPNRSTGGHEWRGKAVKHGTSDDHSALDAETLAGSRLAG